MPFAPGTQDMSGQLLAHGIDRGIAQIGDAIRRSQEERKKKEQEKQAKEAVMKAGQALYGAEFDLKDAPQETWGQIVQLAEAKRSEPMRALQMETQKLANENALLTRALTALHIKQGADAVAQADRNRTAVSGAFEPETAAIDPSEPFSGTAAPTAEQIYRRAALSGADVATLDRLAASLRATRSDEFKSLDFGEADALANGTGQVIVNPSLRQKPDKPVDFTIGPRQVKLVGSKVFDATSGELIEAPKQLDPFTRDSVIQSYNRNLEAIASAKRDSTLGFGESKEAFARRVAGLKRRANSQAKSLGYALPFPEEEDQEEDAPAAPETGSKKKPATQRFQIVQ